MLEMNETTKTSNEKDDGARISLKATPIEANRFRIFFTFCKKVRGAFELLCLCSFLSCVGALGAVRFLLVTSHPWLFCHFVRFPSTCRFARA